ncbi:MAG: site-specific integrase [Armatimonadota bacterium]|nr:site-specific integrase [bacterium]
MRGSIKERPPGSGNWRIQWYVGRDLDGKPKYKNKTFHDKRLAEKELTRILRELDQGTYIESKKMTVAEFLRKWLTDYASGRAGSTYERYVGIVEQHLIPALGHIELSKLQPNVVQKYYNDELKSGRVKRVLKNGEVKGGGLSARSVQQHHAVLRKALKCAVRWGMVGRNICDMVDAPKVERKEAEAFTEAEVRALLGATDGTPHGPIILIAVATGMRLGEILALTWGDIDTVNSAISVTKSVEQIKTGLRIKETKTGSSYSVTVPTKVIDRLMAYKEQQEAHVEELPELVASNNLICPDAYGGYRKPDSMSSTFRGITKKAKVRPLGFHSLRHAHATIVLNRGWDLKFVQQRLGHSTIAITGDIYSHVVSSTQGKIAESLSDLF